MARTNKQSTEDVEASTVEPVAAPVTPRPSRDMVSYVDMTDAVSFDPDDLRGIQSFEDAANLAAAMFGEVPEVSAMLGDGFALLSTEDKARLVGVPLILLQWDFYPGDFGGNFATIRVVARNEDGSAGKYVVNDGSSGIAEMLALYTKRTGKNGGLMARHGFRESTYPFCNDCRVAVKDRHTEEHPDHRVGRATTYYIDTSV